MTSIQISALIYFTVISIGAWIFFGVIFLQLKRFMALSPYVPTVSKILTIILILMTIGGYVTIFIPGFFSFDTSSPTPSKPSGYFDTY